MLSALGDIGEPQDWVLNGPKPWQACLKTKEPGAPWWPQGARTSHWSQEDGLAIKLAGGPERPSQDQEGSAIRAWAGLAHWDLFGGMECSLTP